MHRMRREVRMVGQVTEEVWAGITDMQRNQKHETKL